MDVNAVVPAAAKLQLPPPLPGDAGGEAFAGFLQATDTPSTSPSSPPTKSNLANSAPAQTLPASQQGISAPQQSSASQSDTAASNTAQAASASAQSDNAGAPVTDQRDATAGKQADNAANSNGAGDGDDAPAAGDKSSGDGTGGDTTAQNAAAVLLALLAATAKQTPTDSASGLPSSGKAIAAPEAMAGTAKPADAPAAATPATLASLGNAQSNASSQANGAMQLAGFKAAAAEHALPILPNGGSGSPQADLLNMADAQVAVGSTLTGGPPQSLLAGSLLATANAVGENGGMEVSSSLAPSLAEVPQKPGDGEPVASAGDAPAPAANPVVDGQTGQPQPGGASFVATAYTSVSGVQPGANSQLAGQSSLLNAPVEQVAVHMARAAANEVNRFSIQLDPADLGRVDIKMEVGHDGHVLATIAADRPQTLDMLQRDAAGLQRALQDAGLNADGQSLSFSLRQQGDQANSGGGQGTNNGGGRSLDNGAPAPVTTQSMTNRADDIGLDIRV
jgi:flagellar hook-length control protein FliK